ncbi:hypothetical protein FA15DRAFT_691335 [Coprinopsis marcescibilis]|uniref:Uncharacterized protein n=1 Tax=Coprinopsis marcescibilis TaxID=230819 RepID=A0A5C3L7W4_COPMA|nr:hypothetical protein FA15DRAFT_691335 [Coprinopsis marcescibilis]
MTDPDDRLEMQFVGPTYAEVDFSVVTGGNQDRYNDQTTIVVDDNYLSEIFYFGPWAQKTIGFDASPSMVQHLPFRSVVRIELQQWGADSGSSSQPRTSKMYPQHLSDNTQNLLLVEFTGLDPGEHTLTANLTSIDNQEFIFDHVTYTPAFPNLSAKPSFDVSLLDPALDNRDRQPAAPVGAIVGGVLAGLALVLAVLAFGFWIWKGRGRVSRRAGELNNNTDRGQYRTLNREIDRSPSPPPYVAGDLPETRTADQEYVHLENTEVLSGAGLYRRGAQQPESFSREVVFDVEENVGTTAFGIGPKVGPGSFSQTILSEETIIERWPHYRRSQNSQPFYANG